MQPSLFRRIATVFALILAISAALAVVLPSQAQDDDALRRLLVPDQAVTGTLNTQNFAESYIFEASAGNTITLSATTEEEELGLALLLTNPNGLLIGRANDADEPQTAELSNLILETSGTFVVTVLRSTGADGDTSGEYSLLLTGNITAPPSTSDTGRNTDDGTTASTIREGNNVYISLPDGGIDLTLEWSAAVDLNLEVRDPVGGTLYFDSLTSNSGGTHSENANALCEDATADSPTENVSWPQGYVPVGSYEIIIYYEQACSVGGPQTFTLSGTVNGEDSASISGVVNPGQNYLARLTLDINQNWSLFNGGVNAGLDLSSVPNPQGITFNQTALGTITNLKPKDAYTFNGTSGQSLSITMTATSGSLDTSLILLGPDGRRVADNDDRLDGTSTDSLIETTLPETGLYTIISSRYGQVIGGTEGNYTLFVSPSTGDNSTVDNTAPIVTNTPNNMPAGSIQVTLNWFTGADLQLQVRDPLGATVFDDAATIASGGILDQNYVGNRNCVAPANGGNPTYYIYWPTNRLPPDGTYEVEIWYQNDCNDSTPVNFDLSIQVNGQLLAAAGSSSTVSATATLPGNRYMISFNYDSSGTVSLGEGGFFNMNAVSGSLDYQAQLATAQLIQCDQTVQGTIGLATPEDKFVVYSFEGQAGDRVGVSIQRTAAAASLDTALYILDPLLVQVANNDDIEPGINTNSRIQEYQLERDGTFYIIATHYGLKYGATFGDFVLSLDCLP